MKNAQERREEAQRRGRASLVQRAALREAPQAELLALLQGDNACLRSAAAACLAPAVDAVADSLLAQLAREPCLYPRLAICEALQGGGVQTARKVAGYLGRIGCNQHRALPARPSAKTSYPLPRDLAARTLAKMDPAVFPVLLAALEGAPSAVREALDAVGWMAFYHPALATEAACETVLAAARRQPEDPVLLWKTLLCLSAFPCPQGTAFLQEYAGAPGVLGQEAQRSLRMAALSKAGLPGLTNSCGVSPHGTPPSAAGQGAAKYRRSL